jgi:hypothetical protein
MFMQKSQGKLSVQFIMYTVFVISIIHFSVGTCFPVPTDGGPIIRLFWVTLVVEPGEIILLAILRNTVVIGKNA